MRRPVRRWARRFAASLIAALIFTVPASAAPTNVWLRVEGERTTLFEGPVRSDARAVDGGDGTGPHRCGTSGPTPTTALADAGLDWRGTWNVDFQDFFVEGIGPDASDDATASYWAVLADWRYVAGGCRAALRPGSEVLWAYGADRRPVLLRLTGPTRAAVGETVTLQVTDGRVRATTGADGGPVAGAAVGDATSDSAGRVRLRFDSPGLRVLKAQRADAVRSNALALCVGDAACEATASPPTPAAPAATIAKIRPGERFARRAGPRVLRGTARGETASLTLERRTGEHCSGWDATQRRLAARRCGTSGEAFPVALQAGSWRYDLGADLPPGRYRLVIEAVAPGDARRATAAVTFTVAAQPGSRAAAAEALTRYLVGAQARSGGFGARPGPRPTVGFTAWATFALDRGPASRRTAGAVRAARRLLRSGAMRPRTLAALARSVLALASSTHSSDRRAVDRWRRAIVHRQRPDGSFGDDTDLTALAVLALRGHGPLAARERRARRWLLGRQLADGSFAPRTGATQGTVDSTGYALWALGHTAPRDATRRAYSFLRAAEAPDGGLPASSGHDASTTSTALAVLGLRAAGLGPTSVRTEDGITPTDYLRARVNPDGSTASDTGPTSEPVWLAANALLALGHRTAPPRPVRRHASRASAS